MLNLDLYITDYMPITRLEPVPYKQRVVGSIPTVPTETSEKSEVFFYALFEAPFISKINIQFQCLAPKRVGEKLKFIIKLVDLSTLYLTFFG